MMFQVSLESPCYGEPIYFEFPDISEAFKFITNALLRFRDPYLPSATISATIKIMTTEEEN